MKKWLLWFSMFLAGWAANGPWRGVLRCEKTGRSFCAIRNQREYDDFVSRIPKERLQMKQPAPPSTDPLLQQPEVDFEQQALVAIWSSNIHIGCEIRGTHRDGADLVVDTAFDAPSDWRNYAAPDGYGRYYVVEVDAFPGELKLGAINKKAPGRQDSDTQFLLPPLLR